MDEQRIIRFLPVIVTLLFWTAAVQAPAGTEDVPRMTKEDAKALLGSPKAVFVDARIARVWKKSSQRIPGAVRPDRWDPESWAARFDKDTTFIVYCT